MAADGKKVMEIQTLLSLPEDLLLRMLYFLQLSDLMNIALVAKKFSLLVNCPQVLAGMGNDAGLKSVAQLLFGKRRALVVRETKKVDLFTGLPQGIQV